MGKLEQKNEKLLMIYHTTQQMIDLYQHPKANSSDLEIAAYTASVIKHYELLFEILWKTLKVLLSDKYGTETAGSKEIFRACFSHKLITKDELDLLLALVQKRNLTAHVYDQATAKEICSLIIQDFDALSKIIERIAKS